MVHVCKGLFHSEPEVGKRRLFLCKEEESIIFSMSTSV